ncbi:MAG TPA: MFS transporter [Terriglobales bacterium]|nr:MFS transporter [Terriglobales bacterium]
MSATSPPDGISENIGRYRWKICALLFFATTINYVDRQAVALLKPVLQDPVSGIGLTEVDYGYIVTAFSLAYALGLLVVGGFIDRVGTKIGYAVAIAVWGVAAASHSLVSFPSVVAVLNGAIHFLSGALGWKGLLAVPGAVAGFAVARFVLGLGESGNFPACIKTVAEWFPQKERALATGIFNSGANVAALIAPLAVPWIAIHLGWRWGFLFTGLFSATWLVFWWRIYRHPQEHPKVSAAELRYINSAPPEATSKISWLHLFSKRQAWAIFVGKILTDPVWWFYLYWLPGFLNRRYGLPIGRIGLPLVVIYNMSAVGSIYGGWLPGKFLSLGWSPNRARKTAMLIYAIAVLPVVFVGRMQGVWSVVALLGLATAAHQAWSANMFTLASDMFPRRAVASVVGLGTSGAALLMAFISTLVGYVLKWTNGNYAPLFVVCGTGYLMALLMIQLLAPNLKRAELD